MTFPARSRLGADMYRRLLTAALLAILLVAPPYVGAQAGLHFDVSAAPLVVLSGDGLAPVLAHGGFSLAGGTELRSGGWIPARVQLEYYHVFPSAISPAGDLYRSWAGWDLALAAGAVLLSREDGAPFGLDLLGGVSFGAARYPGTTVAFATFSGDLSLRADFSIPGSGGWRAVLPLSYILRPGARSFSAGLGIGWLHPPRRGAAAAERGGGG